MMDFYQRIGQAAIDVAEGADSKLLLYSEVEDGVISADLFFQSLGDTVVRFRFAPKVLQDLIYAFWESGDQKIKPCSWRAMEFVISDGKFSVELMYPEQVSADEDLSDRRPGAIAKVFPGLKVDYSKPNG
jgi:hypothetical protein